MNKEELMKILPHREDMLLLDEAECRDEIAYGYYKVRGDEFFLRGHFPGNPIVPGVILCEILAQSTCVLVDDFMKEGKTPVYTGMKEVKFRNPVRPGDLIETKCKINRKKHPYYFAEGELKVGDVLCATAEFSFALIGE